MLVAPAAYQEVSRTTTAIAAIRALTCGCHMQIAVRSTARQVSTSVPRQRAARAMATARRVMAEASPIACRASPMHLYLMTQHATTYLTRHSTAQPITTPVLQEPMPGR